MVTGRGRTAQHGARSVGLIQGWASLESAPGSALLRAVGREPSTVHTQ